MAGAKAMNPGTNRWHEIEPILDQALELETGEREAFVARACGADDDLLDKIEALITADVAAEGLFTTGRSINLQTAPSVIGTTVGPYRLLETIGTGGMGRVFLAERSDGEFEQQVAIKFLSLSVDPRAQERFQTECQNLARLDHPNIAHLLDGGVADNGASYLVLHHVDGESIDHFVRIHQSDLRQRMQLFIQLCDAVQYAHRNLIVHRDLKPSNVLVTEDAKVKLLDFGISHDLSDDGTATNSLMTPRYASPEQILGQPITIATDVYGLGMILHHLLTGEPPFSDFDGSIQALAARAKRPEPPLPSGLNIAFPVARRSLMGDLDAMMLKCLQAEPVRRYESVAALRDDVRSWLDGRAISARRPRAVARFGRLLNRHRWASGLSAALLATVVGAASYHLRTVKQERDGAVATTTFLIELLQNINPNYSSKDGALAFPITELYTTGLIELTGSGVPEIEQSRLARAFSVGFKAVGDHEKALLGATQAVKLAAAQVPGSTLHIRSMVRRAAAHTDLYQFEQAEQDYQWLIAQLDQGVPEHSIDAAIVWSDYGVMLSAMGQPADAEPKFRKAKELLDLLPPDEQVKHVTLTVLDNLSTVMRYDPKRNAEAWEFGQERIDRSRAWFGEDSMAVARAYAAAAVLDSGDPDEVLQMSRQAYLSFERVLGPEHAETLSTQNNYALKLLHGDRINEALPLFQEVLERRRLLADSDPVSLADSYQNLAVTLRRKEFFTEATDFSETASDVYAEALPADHWRHAMPLLTRAEIALAAKQPKRALELAQSALRSLEQLPDDNAAKKAAQALAAVAMADLNRCVDPTVWLTDQALEALRKSMNQHPMTDHLVRLAQARPCQ